MLVHILSAFPGPPEIPGNFAYLWLRESAAEDPFYRHQLTDDPARADLILFVESHPGTDPFLLEVVDHPLYRRFPEKCFLYHDSDVALPLLRGVYPSIRRQHYQPERCRSGGYIARISVNEFIRYDPAPVERRWLYSFYGEANSEVRRVLFAQSHPRGCVRDTTGRRHWQMQPGPERDAFTREFADSIQKSQFVLCPGGVGPSTYRLFETMEMGRVPVILSDDWVSVPGPEWSECSIRVPENQVSQLEAILSQYSTRCEEMGRRARENWEQHFSKAVSFHRMVELCASLMPSRPSLLSALRPRLKLLQPPFLRIWLRPKFHRLKASFRQSAHP